MDAWTLDDPGEAFRVSRSDRALSAVAPGLVRVALKAAAVNYRDVLIAKGRYPFPARPDVVVLSDGAGEVVEVGTGVSDLAPGDRVTSVYFPKWQDGPLTIAAAAAQFGCSLDGMAVEVRDFTPEQLMRAPGHLSFEEAATLPCAGVTAWAALTGLPRAPLAGETVLVTGAGGVALFAIQFARIMGLRVIAAVRGEDRMGALARLGADEVVRADTSLPVEVRRLTGGAGADHIVDGVGAPLLAETLRSVAIGGQIALVGALGGDTALEAAVLGGAFATTQRIAVGSRAQFQAVNRAISHHRLRPVIDRVRPFAQLPLALADQASGGLLGKVVVRIEETGA